MFSEYHAKHTEMTLKYGAPMALPLQTGSKVLYSDSTANEGMDFGKMQEIVQVHRRVVHGVLSHNMGLEALKHIEAARPRISTLWRIVGYGLLSIFIGFFAFGAQPADAVPSFFLGCLLGWMQIVLTQASPTFSTIFPFFAPMVQTLIARAVGAITINGQKYFCWQASASASLASILPSYLMLIAVIELQGINVQSGTFRLASSVVYSLMFILGISSGIVLFGESFLVQAL